MQVHAQSPQAHRSRALAQGLFLVVTAQFVPQQHHLELLLCSLQGHVALQQQVGHIAVDLVLDHVAVGGRVFESFGVILVDLRDPFAKAARAREPRVECSGRGLARVHLLPQIVPTLIAQHPLGVQREAVPVVDPRAEERPEGRLVHVLPRPLVKPLPHDQILLVQLLREVKVEALRPVPHAARLLRLFDGPTNYTVRRGVAETEPRDLGVKAFVRLCLEHLEPSSHPTRWLRVAQHSLQITHQPLHEINLILREAVERHVLTTDQKCVQVTRHWLHDILLVRYQKAARVHRVDLVILPHDRLVVHVDLARRVEVGVHERRLRGAARLPAGDV
mmetsp:Transcript_92575/g.264519  ORF Transcript_92575/g.264519 Transcript_92575/m.264519 type:complete len:333 (-) Transcript_92575:309-1307(-)